MSRNGCLCLCNCWWPTAPWTAFHNQVRVQKAVTDMGHHGTLYDHIRMYTYISVYFYLHLNCMHIIADQVPPQSYTISYNVKMFICFHSFLPPFFCHSISFYDILWFSIPFYSIHDLFCVSPPTRFDFSAIFCHTVPHAPTRTGASSWRRFGWDYFPGCVYRASQGLRGQQRTI